MILTSLIVRVLNIDLWGFSLFGRLAQFISEYQTFTLILRMKVLCTFFFFFHNCWQILTSALPSAWSLAPLQYNEKRYIHTNIWLCARTIWSNSKKRERLITLNETEETLCEGTFGALSAKNLFHFRFSSAQRLRAPSLNSRRQLTYNWLYNRIETDRQPSFKDSYKGRYL